MYKTWIEGDLDKVQSGIHYRTQYSKINYTIYSTFVYFSWK